eukprot:CAMPEP_0195288462 /NCGR_PEP_ID=MMETSP0707-20130614/5119_1 /TAXON_ID=33640 /ORGANISM="Asterionellopsis glacialis, Strain CCMP134" /LENGTH=596 /DNA_ID=CAMNT_0040348333 /DNA_START=38 /DNA_END=1828 /DNA_ORIENTATION=+
MKDSAKVPASKKKNSFAGFKIPGGETNTCKVNSNKFPMKLMKILSSPEAEGYKHIVTWLPDGKSFKVLKPKEFSANVLHDSKPFKTFRRQACRWGFRTKSDSFYGSTDIDDYYDEATTFTHKRGLFQKGRYDLLDCMKTSEPPCKQKKQAKAVAAQALGTLSHVGGQGSPPATPDSSASSSLTKVQSNIQPELPKHMKPASSSTRMPVFHPTLPKIMGPGGVGPSVLGAGPPAGAVPTPGGEFDRQMSLKSILGKKMEQNRRSKLCCEVPTAAEMLQVHRKMEMERRAEQDGLPTAVELLHIQRKQLWDSLMETDGQVPSEASQVHAAARKGIMMGGSNPLSSQPAAARVTATVGGEELVRARKEIERLKKLLSDAVHERNLLLKQRDLFIRDSSQANAEKDGKMEDQETEIRQLRSEISSLKGKKESDLDRCLLKSKLRDVKTQLSRSERERAFLTTQLEAKQANALSLHNEVCESQGKCDTISKEAEYYKRLYNDSVSENVKMKLCLEKVSEEALLYKNLYKELEDAGAAHARMQPTPSGVHLAGNIPSPRMPSLSRAPVPPLSTPMPGAFAGNALVGNSNATRALLKASFRRR